MHGMVKPKRVCKMQYCQTIFNLNKLDRISNVILISWVMYVSWDVQDVSYEVGVKYVVSLNHTKGQSPFCSSLVS